jgi:hypothetical protein
MQSSYTRHVRRRHQPRRRATNTDQDGPRSALRWTDACSYTILTHYRQWGSCKAVGEHQVSPCRDNLRIVCVFRSQTRKKRRIFCSCWWWLGRTKVLSQMCLIWKKRVLTISPSFIQCRFLQIPHLLPLARNCAKASLTTQRPYQVMVKVCLRTPHHPTSYPIPNYRPRAWKSPKRRQTIPRTPHGHRRDRIRSRP